MAHTLCFSRTLGMMAAASFSSGKMGALGSEGPPTAERLSFFLGRIQLVNYDWNNSLRFRVGEDTFEMYLRYRYMRGCIFQILRYRYH